MIISLLLILHAFVISYLIGKILIGPLAKWFKVEQENLIPAYFALIGLCIIGLMSGIFHLFFALNQYFYYLLLLIIFASFRKVVVAAKEFINHFKENGFAVLLLLLAAVISVVARPGTGDIGDYHLQAIQWAEKYQNITGLGNFNRPLANNNWWFNLQAVFGLGFIGLKSIYILNALFFVLTMAILIFEKVEDNFLNVFRYVLATFVALSTKTAFVGSVTPDYIVTCLIFISSYSFLKYYSQEKPKAMYLLILVFISAFSITIKLTSVFIILLALIAIWEIAGKRIDFKLFLKFDLLYALFFIPWLIGNVIISGWLVYPISSVDLFSFDWKLPKDVLDYERFSIMQWGKIPFNDIYATAQLSISEWLPIWFKNLDLFNRTLVLATLISLIVSMLILSVKRNANRNFYIILAFAITGIALCLGNGPHIRYAFGYIMVLLAINSSYIYSQQFDKKILGLRYFFIFLSLIPILVISGRLWRDGILPNSILKPQEYPLIEVPLRNIGNQKVYITHQNSSCWDNFPCSYYMVKGCELRGGEVSDGFKVKVVINDSVNSVIQKQAEFSY